MLQFSVTKYSVPKTVISAFPKRFADVAQRGDQFHRRFCCSHAQDFVRNVLPSPQSVKCEGLDGSSASASDFIRFLESPAIKDITSDDCLDKSLGLQGLMGEHGIVSGIFTNCPYKVMGPEEIKAVRLVHFYTVANVDRRSFIVEIDPMYSPADSILPYVLPWEIALKNYEHFWMYFAAPKDSDSIFYGGLSL